MNDSKTLIFCHTAGHVISALPQMSDKQTTIVIPTSPEAALECQKRNIYYCTIDKYIDKENIFAQRAPVLETNMEWLLFVDNALQQIIPRFKENQFSPARLYTFAFFGFLDEVFIAGYLLKSIFNELKPSHVVTWDMPIISPGTWSRIMPRGAFYTFFIPQIAEKEGIKLTVLPESSTVSVDNFASVKTAKNNWKIDPMHSFYRTIGKLFSSKIKREFKLLTQTGAVKYFSSIQASSIGLGDNFKFLFLGEGYDLDSLCVELRLKGCTIDRLEDPSVLSKKSPEKDEALKKELAYAWDSISTQADFWKPFIAAGIEPNEISLWILKRWWFDILPLLWHAFEGAKVLFEKNNYSGVVNWAFGEGVNGAVVVAAKAANVSSFCWQHGGASRNIWEIDTLQELFFTDYYFSYGSGTKRMFDRVSRGLRSYGSPAKIIPAGSARLDAIYANAEKKSYTSLRKRIINNYKKPLVLYIPTVYESPGWRLADQLITGVSYFEFQQKILSLFNKFENIEFIYKGFPGTLDSVAYNPIQDYINNLENKNIHYIVDVPVTKLMWAADVLIIDHNQTAINELLLTKKPVIVFEQGSMSERVTEAIALDLLKKRASVARTQEEFFDIVKNFLQKGDFREIHDPNDEFLKEYGTHLNDGASAERAAEYILKLLKS